MKHVLSLICFLCAGNIAIAQTTKEYCNTRFSFCVPYPEGFLLQEEAANGDGRVILSKDEKTEIRAFGALVNTEGAHLQEAYKLAVSDLKVAYKVMKKEAFIISGTDKAGNVVYRKTVIRKINYLGTGDTPVFQTLMITYPAAQQALYAPYCTQIARSL